MEYDTTPGPDLKAQRIAAGVPAKDLAARMGMSYPNLWRLERSASVSFLRSRQYLDALRSIVEPVTP